MERSRHYNNSSWGLLHLTDLVTNTFRNGTTLNYTSRTTIEVKFVSLLKTKQIKNVIYVFFHSDKFCLFAIMFNCLAHLCSTCSRLAIVITFCQAYSVCVVKSCIVNTFHFESDLQENLSEHSSPSVRNWAISGQKQGSLA